MARLNEEGQWIILMGFIISFGIFFLAILMNQSMLVGQTTAESVLEFPKSDLQDLRSEVRVIVFRYPNNLASQEPCLADIEAISISNKTAIVDIKPLANGNWNIHYNNGVTRYNEEIQYWDF